MSWFESVWLEIPTEEKKLNASGDAFTDCLIFCSEKKCHEADSPFNCREVQAELTSGGTDQWSKLWAEADCGCVSVPEGDAVFVVKLQDFTATEKDEMTLDCELSKDVPVVWYHSEKEITASKMVVIKSEGTRRTLVLKKVEQSDKGKYVCDCGTDKTSANINIEGKERVDEEFV